MDVPAELSADLRTLTAALDEPGVDLEVLLRAVLDGTRVAVPSYLGLTVSLLIDGRAVVLTALDRRRVVRTSVRVPLDGAPTGTAIVFYGATPGAFVDFAADASYALGTALESVVLDADLTPVDGVSEPNGLTSVAETSRFHQAIGVLIAGGHPPEHAATELHRLAELAAITVSVAALRLVQATITRPRAEPA